MTEAGKGTAGMESQDTLEVNGRQTRTVRLSIDPGADFREVVHAVESIGIPPVRVNAEHVRFAILELVNNSVRAHKERGESRSITLDFTAGDGRLVVAVRDFGGGFDPARLPYPLDADPATLDLHSAAFEDYQKRNGYKRFGMGIYVAKKTFDEFRLVFLDPRDRPTAWAPGACAGTLITLAVTAADRGEGKDANG
jgi:anti-sigma regulatory factor (Ser/Thr protein kinase)